MGKRLRIQAIVSCFAVAAATVVGSGGAAADELGVFDPSFEAVDYVYLPKDSSSGDTCRIDEPNDVLIDSANRPVIVSDSYCSDVIWRLTASGGVDTTFGYQGGYVPGFHSDLTRVLEDSTGRLVVIGGDHPSGGGSPWDILFGRLSSDGIPDTSIGSDPMFLGFRSHNFDGMWYPKLSAMDSSDRVILAMGATFDDGDDFLMRLTVDGAIDTTFPGIGVTSFGTGESLAGLAIDDAGRIVVAVDTPTGPELRRFSEDGVADSSFGGGSVPLGGDSATYGALENATGGTIVVGVDYESAGQTHALGVDTAGTVIFETPFNRKLAPRFTTDYEIPHVAQLAIGGQGRIIGSDGYYNELYRLTPSGLFDAAFGEAGVLVIPSIEGGPTWLDWIMVETKIAVDAMGRVVIAGHNGSVARLVENPTQTPPPEGFDDVPDGHLFDADIQWLAEAGITKGCNPPENTLYCPDATVTRGQMAAFLHRALDGSITPSGDPVDFTDAGLSVFGADIEWLSAAGITAGCNPPVNDEFCPNSPVTRGQMAAFLVRALEYSDDGGGNLFADDNESIFEAQIDKLATAGVTRGCNPPTNDRFCPDAPVTRGQMAAFLHRALVAGS